MQLTRRAGKQQELNTICFNVQAVALQHGPTSLRTHLLISVHISVYALY